MDLLARSLVSLSLVFVVALVGCGDDATVLGDTGVGDGGRDGSVGDGGGDAGGDTGTDGSVGDGGGDTSTGDSGVCTNPGTPSGELLWLTFDDAASITSPLAGNGTGATFTTTPADDFTMGQVCDGIRIDEDGELVQLVQENNINWAAGTIDFWYLPDAGHRDGLNHVMFSSTNNGTRGGFICRKAAMDNGNAFQVIFFDDSGTFLGETAIAADEYAFAAGTWVNIRVTWDFGVGAAEQNVRVYFDGTEPTYASTTVGPASMPTDAADEQLRFGVRNTADEWPAGGVLDELRIYDSAMAP